MVDDKAADMDFNFSDANFDMSAAGGDFEMPSMDLGDAGGDFKFDAGDDGAFNFGATDDVAAGGEGGGDFNFDNMSMPSFMVGDDAAGDKKDEAGAASSADKKDPKGGDTSQPPPISMTDDPLNSISDMPDIPMSLGMSQGSSQGSHGSSSQGQGHSSRSRRASKSRKSTKKDTEGGAKASTNVGGVRVTPAKTRRSKSQQAAKADEEQKETPSKADVSMSVAQPGAGAVEGGSGGVCAKRKAAGEGEVVAKKPKTPKQQEGPGESLRATKDMMRASNASDEGMPSGTAAAASGPEAQQPPQTPMVQDAKKEKKSHKSSGKSRSSKKRASGASSSQTLAGAGSGGGGAASSSSHHHLHKSDKKHKSKSHKDHRSKGGDANMSSQETPRSGSEATNVSLQEIVSEAQGRMNEITETMTRIEKELHQKTSLLATNFVQQMFGMCNNFGMSCQQQILMMNQVAYRNDHLRKNVCKALELSNRLRGMQKMKSQLSSIKDSFCPNL